MSLLIRGGLVLHADGRLRDGDVLVLDGTIATLDAAASDAAAQTLVLDAAGRLVLPGIVDVHGDSFEMQIQPRPGTRFPLDLALADVRRHFAVNGITTGFLAQGLSWEGGLRGTEQATAMVAWRRRQRSMPGVDLRLHLRHEIHNVAAEARLLEWLAEGDVDLVVFNDHLADYEGRIGDASRLDFWAAKAGASIAEFVERIRAARAAESEVEGSLRRLADAAAQHGVPLGSHDDESPALHDHYAAIGTHIAEFPLTLTTARHARSLGHPVIMGAPNIVRGGSSAGNVSAIDIVADGSCTALCSDYYLPALAAAPFRIAAELSRPIEAVWSLVSSGPAEAAGLEDRGRLAPGRRADIVILDPEGGSPSILATIAGGRVAHAAAPVLPLARRA